MHLKRFAYERMPYIAIGISMLKLRIFERKSREKSLADRNVYVTVNCGRDAKPAKVFIIGW